MQTLLSMLLATVASTVFGDVPNWETCYLGGDRCASNWECCVAPADCGSQKRTCRPGGGECSSCGGGGNQIPNWATCNNGDRCAGGWQCCVAPADCGSGKKTCRPGGGECSGCGGGGNPGTLQVTVNAATVDLGRCSVNDIMKIVESKCKDTGCDQDIANIDCSLYAKGQNYRAVSVNVRVKSTYEQRSRNYFMETTRLSYQAAQKTKTITLGSNSYSCEKFNLKCPEKFVVNDVPNAMQYQVFAPNGQFFKGFDVYVTNAPVGGCDGNTNNMIQAAIGASGPAGATAAFGYSVVVKVFC